MTSPRSSRRRRASRREGAGRLSSGIGNPDRQGALPHQLISAIAARRDRLEQITKAHMARVDAVRQRQLAQRRAGARIIKALDKTGGMRGGQRQPDKLVDGQREAAMQRQVADSPKARGGGKLGAV